MVSFLHLYFMDMTFFHLSLETLIRGFSHFNFLLYFSSKVIWFLKNLSLSFSYVRFFSMVWWSWLCKDETTAGRPRSPVLMGELVDCDGLGFSEWEGSHLFPCRVFAWQNERVYCGTPYPTLDVHFISRRFIHISWRDTISALISGSFFPLRLGCTYLDARCFASRNVSGKCHGCYSIYRLSTTTLFLLLFLPPALHCLCLLCSLFSLAPNQHSSTCFACYRKILRS